MRVFWIIVGVLALAAAVVAFRSSGSDDRASSKASETADTDQPMAPADDAADRIANTLNAPNTPASNANAHTQQPTQLTSTPESEALVGDLMDSANDSGSDSIDAALADHTTPAGAAGVESSLDPAHPIDGKYIVAGSGTKDDPFQITWDLLLLAAQTYVPREGRSDIPPQLKAIDGAHIRIEGYFAFPLASTDAREVLFMLNMWDGCCIGVPPSPYDAIEVRLKDSMGDGRKQYVNYGTLSGVIKVDPYVQEGWLLGMYLMHDGVIDAGL